jgi:hypothetical protein
VLMASHELDLARKLATREVRLAAGQIRESRRDGAPARPGVVPAPPDHAEACA